MTWNDLRAPNKTYDNPSAFNASCTFGRASIRSIKAKGVVAPWWRGEKPPPLVTWLTLLQGPRCDTHDGRFASPRHRNEEVTMMSQFLGGLIRRVGRAIGSIIRRAAPILGRIARIAAPIVSR
jgi:hypothetical protein